MNQRTFMQWFNNRPTHGFGLLFGVSKETPQCLCISATINVQPECSALEP